MINSIKITAQLILILFSVSISTSAISQTIDTLANWDSYNQEWSYFVASSDIVPNPEQQGINPSEQCLKIITNNDPYSLIYADFNQAFNFIDFPLFRLKVKAPLTGGSILLKFENSDNSSWEEIEKFPNPGEWDDLEFDFSGITTNNYKRMAIFFDFGDIGANQEWFLDDILRVGEGDIGLTSNLPLVIINTNNQEINNEDKITARMGIVDNGPEELNNQFDPYNDYDGFIGIKIRGQSSQMFPKKSYSVETRDEAGENLNIPLLDMPEENDWVFYAPYSDKSMLRNYMSFFLAKELDRYSSRTKFCELIIDNEYLGVYILMEKIKRDDKRVNIAKLNADDISGDELTGGYIVKVDKIRSGFSLGRDGWRSEPNPPYPNTEKITFQYVEPEPDEMEWVQKNYIKSYVQDAENAIVADDFNDPNLGYQKFLNVGSFIDQMLLNEVSKEVDKYRFSTYFFKEKDSDGGKFFAGPPWDFNLGYSNVNYWNYGNDYTDWVYPLITTGDWSIMFWWNKLMEDTYFQNLSKTRWEELRLNGWSDVAIQEELDDITRYLDEAQGRNFEKWPIIGQWVWPNYNFQNDDYIDEVAYFKNWLFNRLHWIDENISGNTLFPSAELTGELPDIEITLNDDYFSRRILKNKYFEVQSDEELIVDTILYIDANKAMIKFEEGVNPMAEFSIKLKAKILNSFNDLSTATNTSINDFVSNNKPPVKIYTTSSYLYFECKNPNLLGENVELYSLQGQLTKVFVANESALNKFTVSIPSGMYICRYKWNNTLYSDKVMIVN